MEVKAFITEYNNNHDKLFKTIEKSIHKNVLKADEIVNNYLDEIKKGNYSIKSYKAKIIRNEQDHAQTDKTIEDVFLENRKVIEELLNQTSEHLLDDVIKISNEKKTEKIKEELKNKKNSFVVAKENLEKRYKNEYKSLLKREEDKRKTIKNQLLNELEHAKQEVEAKTLEYERLLLETEDKKKIKELKKLISEERKKEIDISMQIKINTSNLIKLTEENNCERKYGLEKQICHDIAEVNRNILQITNDIAIYDLKILNDINNKNFEDDLIRIDKICEKIKNANERIKKQNIFLFSSDDNKYYPFLVACNHFSYLYLELIKLKHQYHLLPFITDLEKEINDIQNNYQDLIENLIKKCETQKELLIEGLKDFVPKDQRETKESFTENVLSSLDRFYNNLFIQIDYTLKLIANHYIELHMLLEKTINQITDNKINSIYSDNNNVINKKIKYHYQEIIGYKLFDEKTILAENIDENDYINIINQKCDLYYQDMLQNALDKKKNIELTIEKMNEDYQQEIEKKCAKRDRDLYFLKEEESKREEDLINNYNLEKDFLVEKDKERQKIAKKRAEMQKKYV